MILSGAKGREQRQTEGAPRVRGSGVALCALPAPAAPGAQCALNLPLALAHGVQSARVQAELARGACRKVFGLCTSVELDQLVHVAFATGERELVRAGVAILTDVTFGEQRRREARAVGDAGALAFQRQARQARVDGQRAGSLAELRQPCALQQAEPCQQRACAVERHLGGA